ncbi:class I adenylate-forming enzyme family protein [Halobellus rufus]|uniref:class I adenylate-forming enzyme family protein n=1 Tax=Halobellus rufus TaxID=1448860 RepID=UPI000678C37B|nr:AMP-binding protein [Halobellus rufus]
MRDWLSHRARIEPDTPALVVAGAGDAYSFGNLDTLVDDLAGRLSTAGVDPGMHLGAVLDSRLEYVCLIHAAMRLGATLVPMGDGLTARELAGQMETAAVDAVVCGAETEEAVVEAAGAGAGDDANGTAATSDDGATAATDDSAGDTAASHSPDLLLTVDDPVTDATEPLSTMQADSVTPAEWDLDDCQLLLFTSGTTGDPKAVRLTTGNLLSSAVASMFRLGFDPDERWLVALSLHHMGGIAPILRMPLYGMTVVFRRAFDAGEVADDLDRYDATATSVVPTMLRRMLERRGTLSDSLRVVLLGGAPAPADLVERCRDYSIPVHPTYGMTETASQIATARPKEAFEAPDTVGRPLFMTDVTVVGEDGEPLPAGESGELVVSGPTVTPGYYGDDAANEEAFGHYGLHTGDVGAFDDAGLLRVLNRVDDRIVTGGENVEPGEVVDVLLDHPDVREAAVVGVPDAQWGERVSAAVVPRRDSTVGSQDTADVTGDADSAGEALDRAELLAFARERLAGFKLPKTVAVVDSLPRTVSGTVDRAAVRELLSEANREETEE